ncbi:hypothetical protein HGRIS_011540 [Hohenbuehelia grisea]|uniref:Uncharacterized protein n=1 Tax=Hohenbuehelia grisea TaxID=104357 RepID=A0ABR3JVE1_9AGAR
MSEYNWNFLPVGFARAQPGRVPSTTPSATKNFGGRKAAPGGPYKHDPRHLSHFFENMIESMESESRSEFGDKMLVLFGCHPKSGTKQERIAAVEKVKRMKAWVVSRGRWPGVGETW